MTEIVKIKNFDTGDRYTITDDGKLYSNTFSNCINKQKQTFYDRDGYERTNLVDVNGKKKGFPIHRIVLETFVGPSPEEMKSPTIDHINGIKDDNRLENLRWMERSINSILGNERYLNDDSIKYLALSKTEKDNIVDNMNYGITRKTLMRDKHMSYNAVSKLINDKKYKLEIGKYTNDFNVLHSLRYDINDIHLVCEMISKGLRNKDISRMINCRINPDTIGNIARGYQYKYISRNYDFSNRVKQKKMSQTDYEYIINMKNFNLPISVIAKTMNVAHITITRVLTDDFHKYLKKKPITPYVDCREFSIFDLTDNYLTDFD